MSDTIKLTDDELSPVRNLREEIFTAISVVGQLKLTHDLMKGDLKTIELQLEEQVGKYKELLKREKELVDSFINTHGIGSLDIETGVFTPEK